MEKYALLCSEYFLVIFGNISILSSSGLIAEAVLFKSHTIEGPRYMMGFSVINKGFFYDKSSYGSS